MYYYYSEMVVRFLLCLFDVNIVDTLLSTIAGNKLTLRISLQYEKYISIIIYILELK